MKQYQQPKIIITVFDNLVELTTSTNVDIEFSELLGGNESEAIN